MGRPTRLTPQLQKKITAAVRKGHYAETVAEANGIHAATFFNWMARGKKGEKPYDAFFEAVTRARAEAEIKLVDRVLKGDAKGRTNGPSKGALHILERTRGSKFATRVNVKVEAELAEFLDVCERVLAPEDFARVLEAYAAWVGGTEVAALAGEASEQPTTH